MNNKKVTIVLMVFIAILSLFVFVKNNNNVEIANDVSEKSKINKKLLTMNLEQTAGAGDYKTVTQSEWPTEGYKFNTELSRCENGSELSWDDENKIVLMSGNSNDKCYIYFDIFIPKIPDVCNGGDILADCIKKYGDKGSVVSNIYIHNSTLTNGAGDNSYRYAGGDYVLTDAGKATGATTMVGSKDSETPLIDFYCNENKSSVGIPCSITEPHYYLIKGDTTQYQTYNEALNVAVEKEYLTEDNIKNFICFGSDASPCPKESIYRIIGVFDGKVKLIKWDYAQSSLLGTDGDYSKEYSDYFISGEQGESPSSNSFYYWNESGTNTWSESNLNKVNLNTNFIKNIGTTWAGKIATTTWKVGGGSWANIGTSVPKTAYQYEVGSSASTTTYDAKVGLMYVSDYEFAANPSAWTLNGFNLVYSISYESARGENWLYGGVNEWTISRSSGYSNIAFVMDEVGTVFKCGVDDFDNGVRPSFNLESSITYASGSGSMNDPIIIK